MTAAARWTPHSCAAAACHTAPPAATLRARILDVLARQSGPASTADVRDALNRRGAGHTVLIERVYAVLVAMERKALVHRSANPAGTRPLWQLGTPPAPIDTTRSHTMHCTVYASAQLPAHTALTAGTLEDRIARIDSPAQAQALAEIILHSWETGAWRRWKPLASAPLAGWLYTASHVDAGTRVDWILRALAHRAQWSRAARRAGQDQQLQDSLRSVSRLDDRQFADLSWMLMLALFPWSSCVRASAPTALTGER